MGKIIDITNQKFGYLTVLNPTRLNGRFAWHCKCDCGNEIDVDSGNLRTGKTKSCGCKKSDLVSKARAKDLTGKRFGFLTVLKPTKDRCGGAIVWECQCDCGNICYIPTSNLSRQHTQSCGCQTISLRTQNIKLKIQGQKFGKLTVLKELPSKNGESVWYCQCECGNTTEAIGWHLTTGLKKSCGCLRSQGEAKIYQLLKDNNINFTTQATFDTCLSPKGRHLRFDFYINNSYLLEYDGEQHYLQYPNNHYSQEELDRIKLYDKIKNKWCEENNIPLIRIKYTQLDSLSINDLILKETEE